MEHGSGLMGQHSRGNRTEYSWLQQWKRKQRPARPTAGPRSHFFCSQLSSSPPPSFSSNDIIQHPLMASLQLHRHLPPRLKCVLAHHHNHDHKRQKGWSNRRMEPPRFFSLFLNKNLIAGVRGRSECPASIPSSQDPVFPQTSRGSGARATLPLCESTT